MDAGRTAATAHRSATRALGRFTNVPRAVREELSQDATIRTLYTPGVLDPLRFAAKVARRLAIDWLRRRPELPLMEPGDVQEPWSWEGRMEARMELRRLERLVATAPRSHRETFRTLFVEERSLSEVVNADRAQVRDRWYKRRRRALSWIRAAMT